MELKEMELKRGKNALLVSVFQRGTAMMFILIIGAVVGIALGRRFKVLVLVPATMLTAIVIAAAGIVSGQQWSALLLTILGTVALLQIGYIAGCLRQVLAPMRSMEHLRCPVLRSSELPSSGPAIGQRRTGTI